ncbi:MAG: HEAT repeat domain-containing protein [Acidobacteria bacterium]|nr:HEAT repeat domain-containing protein [Acidobacteriota bacterium]
MLTAVRRVLGLNEGEWGRAWPLFTYLFLTTAGTVASKATRDALFLDRYRAAELPYVDIAIAVLVGVAVAVYLRGLRWLSMRALQTGTLLFFAATSLVFWWLSVAMADEGPLFIAIYLWVGVFGALAPTQVWTLASVVLTTREAKRSFGFIGSGAILGWIVGGLATSVTARSLGTETLLLWVAASLVASVGLVQLLWRRGGITHVDQTSSPPGLRESLRHIAGSPYLRSIAWVIGLASFATTIAGWQFKAIAKAEIPDTDQLAAFFGLFNMLAGGASLVMQLVLTGRVLRTAGVGVALFIGPLAMASTSLAGLGLGSLAAVSALKASDQVLSYSIDKSTVELLYLPLSAAETFRVKAFIDTVVYRFGDGLGGVAVLVFAAGLGWSPVQVGWVTLAVVAAWLVAAATARRQYVTNLQESILQHRMDAERAHGALLDRNAADALARKLEGRPADILYALSLFEVARADRVHPAIPGLLRHESAEVRVRAVAMLAQANVRSVVPQVEALLRDPQLEVRTEALLYLTHTTAVDPLTIIERVGDFEGFSIQAAMVAFLARPGRAQNVDAAQLILQRMVADGGDDGLRGRVQAARVIGLSPDIFERELRKLLEDDAPEVAREAVRSAGRLGKRALVHRLVDRVAEPWLTDDVVMALGQLGDRIVGTLRDYLVDRDTLDAVRRELPGALQAIGTPAAQAVLVESLLDADTVVRLRVVTALNKLLQLHPDRRVDRGIVETALAAEITGHYRSYQVLGTMGGSLAGAEPVLQALRDSLSQESERIFRLMKVLYPDHDLHSAFVGVQSADPAVHDNALEFLENVLPPQVRALVVPLFDREVSTEERARIAERLVGVGVGSREEAVEVLALSRDPWLQSCAAYAIGELRLAHFAEAVDRWAEAADPLLRATAVAAREKLKAHAAPASVDVG